MDYKLTIKFGTFVSYEDLQSDLKNSKKKIELEWSGVISLTLCPLNLTTNDYKKRSTFYFRYPGKLEMLKQ